MDKIPFSVYDFFGYLASGYFLLFVTDYSVNNGELAHADFEVVPVIFWLIVAYIVGHVIAHLSSHLLEHRFVRTELGPAEDHLLGDGTASRWARVFPGYFKALPPETRERIVRRGKEERVTGWGREIFLHGFTTVKREEETLLRLNKFLALYGFSRNMSTALLFSTAILLWGAVEVQNMRFAGIDPMKARWAALTLIGAVALFYRYLKFYRRYTIEVLITYATPPDRETAEEG